MALICKKISLIKNIYKEKLITKIKENKFSFFKQNLNKSLQLYQNFLTSEINKENTNLNINLFEKNIKSNIISHLNNPENNLGDDAIYNALKLFCYEYETNNKTKEIKEIIIKILNIINESTELFKEEHLKIIIQKLSEPLYKDIKDEIKINFFKKKIKKVLPEKFSFPKIQNKKIDIDIEHNVIILRDNLNENKITAFVELTHKKEDINLYNSLINSLNPKKVLIEIEPFISKNNFYENNNIIRNNLNKISNFSDLKEFKNYLQLNNKDYVIEEDKVIDKKNESIKEIETIIFNSLKLNQTNVAFSFPVKQNMREVHLIDVPYHNYANSFCYLIKDNKDIDCLLDFIKILSLFDMISYLTLNEKFGCFTCASFLDKNNLCDKPTSIEYLFDKNLLPNSLFVEEYKMNKFITEYNNDQSIIYFGNNIKSFALNFFNKINSNNLNCCLDMEFEDFITNNELKDSKYLTYLPYSLILKENSKNFYFNPPLKFDSIDKLVYESFLKNYKEFYDEFFYNKELISVIKNEEPIKNEKKKKFLRRDNIKEEDFLNCDVVNYLNNVKI